MAKLEIGRIYRYGRPYDPVPELVDGLPNYFHQVCRPGDTLPVLERGINSLAPVATSDGQRLPAILISSSPHKIGSDQTPWQDTFDPDNGYVKYFGDTKDAGLDPSLSRGNAALLRQFEYHTSPQAEARHRAAPIIFFRRVSYDGRTKGNIEFQGFGIITRAERITQFHPSNGHYFANYVFEFAVLNLVKENEQFDWMWINARRDPQKSSSECDHVAPASWREWISSGSSGVDRLRRSVARLRIVRSTDQRPQPGSREHLTLQQIYSFYDGRKARFENLASRVTAGILHRQGAHYHEGWLTPPASDHGADFVGRVELGSGFARVKLVVLGQAKCEAPDSATGGNHIARTVARLRRGWLGAYVTTSYFSASVQQEIHEDQYPLALIHGADLAGEVLLLSHEAGFGTVIEYLTDLDKRYESMLSSRKPEEVLYD